MATKRKRTKEVNKAAAPATDAVQPVQPEASGRIAPRKRPDAGAKPSRDEGEASATPEKREGRRGTQTTPRKRRWPLIVAGALLAIVLLVVGIFSWDRWLRYDDAAEFQGEWQTHGTTAVVVVDGETIKLAEDVAYAYALDTGAKTITFKFGNMEGSGRYRFSLDRSQLVITDGEGYSWFSTLTDDIAWMFDQLARAIQGQPQAEPPSNDEATVLDRLSHDASATPQTGAPVETEPETEPEPEPESTEPESEATPTAPETTPESTDGNADANAGDAKDDANKDDAGTSSTPGGVFDVSDLPA